MPGNHGEISVDEQNGVDDDNKRTTRKKKKKKEEEEDDDVKQAGIADGSENRNQSVMPLNSKSRKRFLDRIRKKPKSPKRSSSRSGSRKGGCFSAMRRRRREEEGSPTSPPSDPNDESFTHEMLRVMLESNDFCSNECNPHR